MAQVALPETDRQPLSPDNMFAGTALDPGYVPPRHPLADIFAGMGRAAANGQRVLMDERLYNAEPLTDVETRDLGNGTHRVAA